MTHRQRFCSVRGQALVLLAGLMLWIAGCSGPPIDVVPGGNDNANNNGGATAFGEGEAFYITVPAPDGTGDAYLPGPGLASPSGSSNDPPPPPGQDPTAGEGVVGVFLEGLDGTLTGSSFTVARSEANVNACGGGCLLASRTATSGDAAIRVILANAAGTIWDVTALGTVNGDTIQAGTFVYPSTTAIGGVGTMTGGTVYLDSGVTHSLTSAAASGQITATLPASRAIGTDMVFAIDIETVDGQTLTGTLTVPLDDVLPVYAPE